MPRVYNIIDQIEINEFDLKMWPGYNCQVKCLSDGIFLNVDIATMFIQQRTALDIIRDMTQSGYSNQEIND